jgi:pilus assembly protein Flp/PilA
MNNFIAAVKSFAADENGVTAIEYGLIAALIGVAIVASATALGGKLDSVFNYVASKLVTPAAP